ncbi:MAG TPA: efflux RND transporter periplasmic adaptor subunit [Nannocystis sp.]
MSHVQAPGPRRTLLAAALFAACTAPAAEVPPPERAPSATIEEGGNIRLDARARAFVVVEAIGNTPTDVTIRAPARVAFRDTAISRVGSPIPARVMKIHVQVGDFVRVGDKLATLASPDASSYHAELAHSRLELTAAKDTLERQTQMVAKGVGREYERVMAEMRVRDVEERVRAAKRHVSLLGKSSGGTVIVNAEIEGTVLARHASVGAQVDPSGEPLFEIGNPSDLWVVADVFQDDLPLVRKGSEVKIELASESDTVPGMVSSVGVLLDTAVRRAPVYIELRDKTTEDLKAGMFALALIRANDIRGITVPVGAVLIKDNNKSIVYVETGEGSFARRDVNVGHNFEDRVEIVSGLQAGERVAVQGALLIDGAANQLL